MGENPAALVRLMNEFLFAEPDAHNSGIYAAKTGYHNTREHHLEGTHGGRKTDYSIRLPIDRREPVDKAAAVDISFDTARLRSDFHTIAKYSRRLYDACERRDPRLFDGDQPVIREWFGNTDDDRTVEGWTFHRTSDGASVPASSDSSHLWHIHISSHRAYVENWDAVSGVLDVLLGRPIPEEDMPTAAEVAKAVADLDSAPYGGVAGVSLGEYIVGSRKALDAEKQRDHAEAAADAYSASQLDARFDQLVEALSQLHQKFDALPKENPS